MPIGEWVGGNGRHRLNRQKTIQDGRQRKLGGGGIKKKTKKKKKKKKKRERGADGGGGLSAKKVFVDLERGEAGVSI